MICIYMIIFMIKICIYLFCFGKFRLYYKFFVVKNDVFLFFGLNLFEMKFVFVVISSVMYMYF